MVDVTQEDYATAKAANLVWASAIGGPSVSVIAAAIARIAADRAGLVAEIERLRDGLAGAIAAISDPRGLDDAICCSGHMCGCRGSSHRELLLHDLSEVLARAALKDTRHDADA